MAPLAAVVLLALWRARLIAPEPTLYVTDRSGRYLTEIGDGENAEVGYWALEAPPERIAAAVLAIEDRRFRIHPGVDPVAVGRALLQNARTGRRVSGASTIAMQVARLQQPGSRSYLRKSVEALTAIALTARYGRDALLSHYLRLSPFGNRIRGIGYAARRYLDKPAADLSWAEIAFLCAIPQAPSRMNPYLASGHARAVERGRRILELLRAENVISASEHALASEQIGRIALPTRPRRPVSTLQLALRWQRDLGDPTIRRTFRNRPVLAAALDLEQQERLQRMAAEAVAYWDSSGAGNAAVVLVERGSWEVRAAVGSTDYFDRGHAGAFDYTRLPRSPGSTLKPFLFALALERNVITPATILDDLRRAPGGIANSDDRFLGPLLPRVALANSRNVPAANLLARVGTSTGYELFRQLGLHDGGMAPRSLGLGMVLGGMPVSLERLVRASTALAGDGRLADLGWWSEQPRGVSPRLFSASTARQITLYLADPMARLPSFPRMGATEYPFPVAVKTGTSPDVRDAWTIAWTSRWLLGVWVGRGDFRPMTELTGYRSAALLARRILLELHADQAQGLDDLALPAPEGFVPVRICSLSGRHATPACDQVVEEWFAPGQEPLEECTAHVRVAVDTRSGLPAFARTPARFRSSRTFVVLPTRYAAWAVAHDLPTPPRLLDRPRSGLPRGLSPSQLERRGKAPERLAHLRITSPEPGARLLRDPEVPAARSTVALTAVVEPPAPQLIWYVDGKPYRVVDYPYATRWPLAPGDHRIEARIPLTPLAAVAVRVTVQ